MIDPDAVPLADAAALIGITPDELLEAAARGGEWDPQAFLVMGEWRVPTCEVQGPRLHMHQRKLRLRTDSGEEDARR